LPAASRCAVRVLPSSPSPPRCRDSHPQSAIRRPQSLQSSDCPSSQFSPALKSTISRGSRQAGCYNFVAMFNLFRLWLGAVVCLFLTRRSLMLENLALRQQIRKNVNQTLAEILLFVSVATNAALLIFIAGVLRSIDRESSN